MELSRKTLAEVADRARAEADRFRLDFVRADQQLRESQARLEALRTEIAEVELERESVKGSPKSALTRRLKPLVAQEIAIETTIAELTVRAEELSAESQEADRMASLLDQAHGASQVVDDFVHDQLAAAQDGDATDEHIDEKGH
jgi:uncharacterized protein (DUF3084 family)